MVMVSEEHPELGLEAEVGVGVSSGGFGVGGILEQVLGDADPWIREG